MSGRVVICADDFAMSPGVSRTIVELARAGKLNAISCMASSPRWRLDAALLRNLPPGVELGLHLVLTDQQPVIDSADLAPDGRLPSAGLLARMAFAGRLPARAIEREVDAQFDLFERAVGRPPSFVDGHQHVHLLPGIRRIVIAATARRAPRAWLRTCEDRLSRILQRPFRIKVLVNALQSAGFHRQARRSGLRCNDSFAGLYDFRASYDELFPRFLAARGQFHLVICHPGDGAGIDDPIALARVREASTLRRTTATSAIGERVAA